MRSTTDATSCAWGDRVFPVVDGYIEVPAEAVSGLASHGFVLVG